jgi:2-C-methyl-D-erythritol 4-phosphate cytidylyltransferase
MSKKIIAIVPAAGLGKRFRSPVKKTFVDLKGVPLIIHTLIRLCEEKIITEVVPVLHAEDIDNGFDLIKTYGLHKIKRIAQGGTERQDSIYNALKLLEQNGIESGSIILIHDGVRPVIPEGLIEKLIEELKNYDGAIPGFPVKETLKEAALDGTVISTVERERFWTVQTPQAFYFDTIKKAYEAAYTKGFYATDDAALVENMGARVRIITGSPLNIKVTTPEDMEMVEWIMERKKLILKISK